MPTAPSPARLTVSDLPQNRPTRFDLTPDAEEMARIAGLLGLDDLRKLRFAGEIRADGKSDWRLNASLGATVVQPCVVTLAPVTTRIDEPVERLFLARLPEEDSDDEEIEMPEDDTIEQLTPVIDLGFVMQEALALALPLYPRADDAALETAQFTEPGKEALKDEDLRPFAGLKALKDKLDGGD